MYAQPTDAVWSHHPPCLADAAGGRGAEVGRGGAPVRHGRGVTVPSPPTIQSESVASWRLDAGSSERNDSPRLGPTPPLGKANGRLGESLHGPPVRTTQRGLMSLTRDIARVVLRARSVSGLSWVSSSILWRLPGKGARGSAMVHRRRARRRSSRPENH